MTVPIWSFIRGLAGNRLSTLARTKPFLVNLVTESSLTVLVESTGKERIVRRSELEGAFDDLQVQGELSRAEIRERHSEVNPAYVAALLAEHPEVEFELKPIRLYFRR